MKTTHKNITFPYDQCNYKADKGYNSNPEGTESSGNACNIPIDNRDSSTCRDYNSNPEVTESS